MNTSHRPLALTAGCLLLASACLLEAAAAQCNNTWIAGGRVPGVAGYVATSVRWDPDGPGPRGEHLVFGGVFTAAGNQPSRSLALFDPVTSTFDPLLGDVAGGVFALAVAPNGDLVVGGQFPSIAGVPANSIARFAGGVWSPLGTGTTGAFGAGTVNAIRFLNNGELVIGGSFQQVGGVPAFGVARWNGLGWSAMGNVGFFASSQSVVRALAILPNGDLIAGGDFGVSGVAVAPNIARWNGSTWSTLGAGLQGSLTIGDRGVRALAVLPNGNLLAGGGFTTAGGVPAGGLAVWDGTTWAAFGASFDQTVFSLAVSPAGDVYAAGSFNTLNGTPVGNVAARIGGAWVGTGFFTAPQRGVYTLSLGVGGSLVASGRFPEVSGTGAENIAVRTATGWSPIVAGTHGSISASVVLPGGDVVVSGPFLAIEGVPCAGLARRSGATWTALDPGPFDRVDGLATTATGQLIAAGPTAIGTPNGSPGIAIFDGITWNQIGTVVGGVGDLAVLRDGSIVACGSGTVNGASLAGVARWDGMQWSSLGLPMDGTTGCLFVARNGDLVAGGRRAGTATGGSTLVSNIARWNGTSWSPIGTGTPPRDFSGYVNAVAELADGSLVAAGSWNVDSVTDVARFDGTAWVPLSTLASGRAILQLATLPDGDLLVGGFFTAIGGAAANGVARWNGNSWSAVAGGIEIPLVNSSNTISVLQPLPNGDVLVAGRFQRVGNTTAANLAQLTTSCPATAAAFGSGCSGTGGLNTLRALQLPWLGATFVSEASGLPANAIGLLVFGASTALVPLSLLPIGGAGCTLFAQPDLVAAAVPTAGRLSTALSIPDTAGLVGLVLHHQVLSAELLGGGLSALTSSNRLSLTLGRF
jgi:trimeric autotransporter adhesin